MESRIAPAFAAAVPLGSLDGTNGFKRSGVADGDVAGYSVSAAGDVKGDGFADCSPALSMLTRAAATAGRPT